MEVVKVHATNYATRCVHGAVREDVLVAQGLDVAMHVEIHVRVVVQIVVEIHVVKIVQIKQHTSIITRKTVQQQTQ